MTLKELVEFALDQIPRRATQRGLLSRIEQGTTYDPTVGTHVACLKVALNDERNYGLAYILISRLEDCLGQHNPMTEADNLIMFELDIVSKQMKRLRNGQEVH